MEKTYGQIGYEAYREYSEGRSLVTQKLLPAWEDLQTGVQLAWHASARAIAREVVKVELSNVETTPRAAAG